MGKEKSTTILYMDDDPDDVQLLQDAILSISSDYTLRDAANGIEGLRMLREMKRSDALPCLIVLDINMPGMDGRQTFVNIKRDETLSRIPLVVFSTSSSSVDKLFFQGKNVEYITKPVRYNHLLAVATRLLSYCDN